jgi:D-3-phosphoglycerate dehydrogenase
MMNVIMTAPRLAPEAVAVIEAAGGRLHYMRSYPSAAEVAALAAELNPVAILSRQGPVLAAAMDAAPALRIVARHGVGVEDVDIPAAAARGILVARAPGSNTRAVAEHTLAMILALAKNLVPLSRHVAGGGWREAGAKGRDVSGMRLGLIGCGAIGQAVATLAGAFGMEVFGYDRGGTERPGITRVESLAALWPVADVLSLHVPYSAATRHMVDAVALDALPPGAFVVNTARGGLIDEAALLLALESGHVAGAALDVFQTEPPEPGDALRGHARVIATPHVAGVTDGSLVTMGVMAAECIAAVLLGQPVPAERVVSA